MHYCFPKSLHVVSSNLLRIIFLRSFYLCHIFSFLSPFLKSSPVFLFWKDSLPRPQTWMRGCIKQFPVKPRKQIKMWLWEIAPVKHNSGTGQTRHFLFLWEDSSLPSLKMMKCWSLCKEAYASWIFRQKVAVCMHQLVIIF